MPATKFVFEVTGGPSNETIEGIPVTPGEASDVTVGGITVTGDVSATSATGTATITLPTYTKPGIYSYTITEKDGEYDGIQYDMTARVLYVYVNNNNEVYAVTAKKGNDTTTLIGNKDNATAAKNNLTFVNDYSQTSTEGGTHNLIIKKELTGSQSYADDTFKFDVTVEGAVGEQYLLKYSDTTKQDQTLTVGQDGSATVTIQLKKDETATIYGLSPEDKFEVEEQSNTLGYTLDKVTVNDAKVTVAEGETLSGTGKVTEGKNDQEVVFVNNKEASTPTGVIMNIAPYALMLVLAGGIAVFFLRRRNAE